jgi:hypothetical protein
MRGTRRVNIGKGREVKGKKWKKNEGCEAKNNGKKKGRGGGVVEVVYCLLPRAVSVFAVSTGLRRAVRLARNFLHAAKLCQSETAVLRAQQPELTDRLQTMSHCPVK